MRITLDPEELYRARTFNDGMNSAHSRLTLLTGVATEVLKPGAQPLPPETDEVVLKTSGGTAVVNNLAGFSQVVDQPGNPFDLNTFVAELKKQKLLPENNRSNPNDEVFESSTGELLMDCRRNYMSVDTPRLQGICAEAGSKAQLSDLGVDELTTRGNLAVVSVDGDRPLRQAKRLVAVYATKPSTPAWNSMKRSGSRCARSARDRRWWKPGVSGSGSATTARTDSNVSRWASTEPAAPNCR